MKTSALVPILFVTALLSGCDTTDNYRASMPKEINGRLKITKNTLLERGEKQLSIEFTSNDGPYALRIQSAQAGGRLASKLAYREKGNPWEALSSLHIDLTDKNHKQEMNSLVARQGNRLRKRHEYAKLDKPELILSQIPKELFNRLSKEEYYHELTQVVF